MITLYKNNQPILKAECGVTLGLLKLIYSSDESYSGILLGVKPRLSDTGVPCLVTFDSTSLTYPEYDLIVQADTTMTVNQTTTSRELQVLPDQTSLTSTEEKRNNSEVSPYTLANSPRATVQRDKIADGPRSAETSSDPSGESEQSPSQSCAPSDTFLDVEGSILQDSTVEESGLAGVAVNREFQQDVAYPNVEVSAEIQFNPEEFNFNIGSVIPFQSDKGVRWPCDRCGKDFSSASHLKRHWIQHTNFKPYRCKMCDKRFPFHWDLKRHITKHTGDKPFKCSSCSKSFNTREELKNHNWIHTGKKEHQCHVCHHEFSTQSNLKVHMRKHTGEKPYKCEYCPKSFHMQGHYQYHVRRHTGEKPYKCDICGKAFSYSNNLNEHRNIHTGNRPYSCSQCDKKFTHRSTFKQHLLMHQGHKRYKCHVCSKSFVQCSNYQRHILTHRKKEERLQKCDLCGKELLSRRGIQRHRSRCVKKTIERVNSNEAATQKKTRLKRGEYRCEHCPRVFAYSRRLEAHVTKKHSSSTEDSTMVRNSRGEYHCEHCPKIFTYSRSFEMHVKKKHSLSTEEKTSGRSGTSDSPRFSKTPSYVSMRRNLEYQCSVCGRRFGYNKRLREHLLRDHQHIATQASSSEAVSQTTASQEAFEEVCSTVTISPDRENALGQCTELAGCSRDTAVAPLVARADSSSEQIANRYLPQDGIYRQDNGETGLEALSALSRMSSEVGSTEGSLSAQSSSAPGVCYSAMEPGKEVTVQIRL